MENKKMTIDDIYRIVDEEDIEFIRLQFVDIFGSLKNIAVTRRQLDLVLEGKISLDGNADNWNNFGGVKKLRLIPDLDTFAIFPWRPQTGKVARFMCHIVYSDGRPFEGDCRNILMNAIDRAKDMGYTLTVIPQCEFFLFDCDDKGMPSNETDEVAGFMDVSPLDTGENVRRDIILTLEDIGLDVRSSYHEKAAGQHQLNLAGGDVTKIADDIETFKMVAKIIAKRHGKHATFLPKPRTDVIGSGMKLGLMLLDEDGRDVFADRNSEFGISEIGLKFMGGITAHAGALAAITNPIVNSYKRLVSDFKAPVYLGWSTENEESIMKVGETEWGEKIIELCFPDATSNPYLAIAASLIAGLDGISNNMEAPAFLSEELRGLGRDEMEAKGFDRLPESLGWAVDALMEDELLKNVLGKEVAKVYTDAKTSEWRTYIRSVSEWELKEYLYKY